MNETCMHPRLKTFTFSDDKTIKSCPDCSTFDAVRKEFLRECLEVPSPKLPDGPATKLTGVSMNKGIHSFREPKAPGTPKKDAAGKPTLGKQVNYLSYAGTGAELELLYSMQLLEAIGHVSPEGYGPDDAPTK